MVPTFFTYVALVCTLVITPVMAAPTTTRTPSFSVMTPATTVASRTDRRPNAGGIYDHSVDTTFISWSGVNADSYLQAYNHATRNWTSPKYLADGEADPHNYPTMIQAADGHILVVRGMHNTRTVIHRSPTPHSIEGNWTEIQVPQGAAASYPMPVKTVDGRIFVFYRETTNELNSTAPSDFRPMKYILSLDNGKTWRNSVQLTGKEWAFGSRNRTDHMDEVYVGQLRYVPSTGRIHFAFTLAGGGPTQHRHDVYHRNMYYMSFSTNNLQFYSARGRSLGTQVSIDDLDQDEELKVVETPLEVPAGLKSPDYINHVGFLREDGRVPFVLWFQFDNTTGTPLNYAAVWNERSEKWTVRQVTTGFRFREIEPIRFASVDNTAGTVWRVYATRDGQPNISTFLIEGGGVEWREEVVIPTPKNVQRVEVITGFRDPARILASGSSSAREVSVADGDIYIAGL